VKAHLTATLGFILLSATTISVAQKVSPANFYSISDVVTKWTPDQHLWTKGDIGVSRDKLAGLETWLDQNGSNWTLVLMETASGHAI